jgi:alpha-tubulin suppressor-like RCC1 family protein
MATNFNQYQPYTGYTTTDPNTGNSQDLGQRYITKSYLLDAYPNIVSQLGNRTSPGLWAWGGGGLNLIGVTGLNNLGYYSSPVQVGSLTNWKQVATQFHTLAIKTDGTLWSWGANTDGRCGISNTTQYSSPIQVGALTTWKYIGHPGDHSSVIKNDGTLWTFGANQYGQLGKSNTINYSSPIQVGTLTNWKFVDNGYNHTIAITTTGQLWAWGYNFYGQLGLGVSSSTVYYSSPIQVGALTNWKQVSAGGGDSCLAIKTDGTAWAWGGNFYGQLGLGNTAYYSSPIQVGALTNWKQVSTSAYWATSGFIPGYTLAIKTDGTLWSWGSNAYGELGLSNTTYYSSPVQVGLLTNWKYVSAGRFAPHAIKTDGTLWSWGAGLYGENGLGVNAYYSSPVQVGSLTTWKSVAAGAAGNFAIQDGYI